MNTTQYTFLFDTDKEFQGLFMLWEVSNHIGLGLRLGVEFMGTQVESSNSDILTVRSYSDIFK